jgi:16S rRNA (adenine1518-N6/adenine1519-N6)-dimethyltransferase
MTLTNLRDIKGLLGRHGFRFSNRLGQNFLVDPSVCPRMAQSAEIDGANVLEIGPGVGVLTQELAKRAAKVLSVEIDKSLLPVLGETLADYGNVTVHHGDVLKIDLPQLLRDTFGASDTPLHAVANLPYYITSPILMFLLESRLPLSSITVLVQKEAAERICAPLGTRACGAITAAVRYFAAPELLFTVPPESFFPAPKIESAALRLVLHKTPPVAVRDEAILFRVIRAAFGQRRKTLSNALSAGLDIPKERIVPVLTQCALSPTARAEELTLAQFALLADGLC